MGCLSAHSAAIPGPPHLSYRFVGVFRAEAPSSEEPKGLLALRWVLEQEPLFLQGGSRAIDFLAFLGGHHPAGQ